MLGSVSRSMAARWSARPTDELRYLFSPPHTEPLRLSSGDGASASVRVPREADVPGALMAAAIAEAKG